MKISKKAKRFTRFVGLAAFLVLAGCEDDPVNPDDRTQWLGAWTCNETEGAFAPQSYNIFIDNGLQLDEVEVAGLYNQGENFRVYANVWGDRLVIPMQSVDGITINGEARINASGTSATIEFLANDGTGGDEVSGTLSR